MCLERAALAKEEMEHGLMKPKNGKNSGILLNHSINDFRTAQVT
jgi:hypothetical protein